jgi:sulfonate transport system permease protein
MRAIVSGTDDAHPAAPQLIEALGEPPESARNPPLARAGSRLQNPADWRLGAGWLLPLVGCVIWEVLAQAAVLPAHWFPAPSHVLETLFGLASDGALVRHVGATLARVGAGFSLGALGGTAIGIATGRSRGLRALVDPALQALRSIPSLAWVPLFMLWLGIGESSKVALIALGVFFPVYLNLTSALAALDARWLEVARLFGYRGWRLVKTILLPGTLPAYLAGLRSGLGLGWMFVVAAELMGASRGLGYLLVDGQTTSRPELVMAAILCFALLGKLTDRALERLGQRWEAPRPGA